MTEQHWSVEIKVDGENILYISHNELGGVDNVMDYEDTIRMITRHLLVFVGNKNSLEL